MTAYKAKQALNTHASPEKARILSSFFKTGPGEYGENDIFIGVKVPETRKVAKQFQALPKTEILKLLHSAIHEERLLALFVLIIQYEQGSSAVKTEIINLYLKNTARINNWDLVDLSAYKLLGDFLSDRPRDILNTLARSSSLWERRIAIVSTLTFIRRGQFNNTFHIADILMSDKEPLIHKAVGWMLRETGKRNTPALEAFLKPRTTKMPRTMLHYAIERFPEEKRKKYLAGKI